MTDVFDQSNQDTNNNNNVAPNVSSDPLADKLKEIVNEQGQPKYKDPIAAIEALKASQEHIKRLEAEKQAEKQLVESALAEKTRADALEEIVKRMTGNPNPPKQVETPTNAGMSEEATRKLLESVLASREAETAAKQNATSVSNALLAKFGDKTRDVVAAKAKELGMTPQELGALSSKSPQMVLTVFGVNSTPPSAQSVSPSSTRIPVDNGNKVDLNMARRQGKQASDLVTSVISRPEKSLISGPNANDKSRKVSMDEIRKYVHEFYEVN